VKSLIFRSVHLLDMMSRYLMKSHPYYRLGKLATRYESPANFMPMYNDADAVSRLNIWEYRGACGIWCMHVYVSG
jgi:hypothetical protein